MQIKYMNSSSVFIHALIPVLVVFQGPLEQTPPSVLAALAHGFEQRDTESSKPTFKIRVDFKVNPFLQFITCNGHFFLLLYLSEGIQSHI